MFRIFFLSLQLLYYTKRLRTVCDTCFSYSVGCPPCSSSINSFCLFIKRPSYGPFWTAEKNQHGNLLLFYNDRTVFKEEAATLLSVTNAGSKLFLAFAVFCCFHSFWKFPRLFTGKKSEETICPHTLRSAAMSLSPEEMFYLATGLLDLDSWADKSAATNNEHSRTTKCAGKIPPPLFVLW